MARTDRRTFLCPLLATSQTDKSLFPQNPPAKSLFRNILPISLTRSIFCRKKFFSTVCFQDFARCWGGGGTPQLAPRTVQSQPSAVWLARYHKGNRFLPVPFSKLETRNWKLLSHRSKLWPTHYHAGNRLPAASFNSKLETRNWKLLLAASLLSCINVFAQSTLAPPAAITDPTKLQSKNVENMQNFSIEKLYTTRNIGGTTWSPDGKQIAFVSNISGRNNIWLVPADGGWPTQLTISDQRQTSARLVARRQLDRLRLRLRRQRAVGHLPRLAQDRRGREPDHHQGNLRGVARLVARWQADRLHRQAQRRLQLRDRSDGRLLPSRPAHHPEHSRERIELSCRCSPATASRSPIPRSAPTAKTPTSSSFDLASGKSRNLTPHEGEQTLLRSATSRPTARPRSSPPTPTTATGMSALLDIATGEIDWLTNDKWEISSGIVLARWPLGLLDRQR